MPTPASSCTPSAQDPLRERLHALLARFASREMAIKPGLERIAALCEALGHPERRFPAVHVTGTNGKGSVVALVASALSAAGLRVGRYTSPHLVRWNERITVAGREIPTARFLALAERLAPRAQAVGATVFELVTAVALAHFAESAVDLAVVEVGLGGRFDATNVVRPLVCVLTGVAADHTELLGKSLASIAWEKVGILKGEAPLVSGPLPRSARPVVAAEVARTASPWVQVAPLRPHELSWEGQTFHAPGWGPIRLSLLGPHQGTNLAVALATLEQLQRHLPLKRAALVAGLEAASWPGRFQRLREAPIVVVDGAHNPQAVRALRRTLDVLAPGTAGARRWLLFGCRADKDYEAMARLLFPAFERLGLVRIDALRALEPEALRPYARQVDARARCFTTASQALAWALGRARPQDLICIAGSLYLVGEVYALLGES